jgi:GxxExxY protein
MINKVTEDIIGAAIKVHKLLGPGLLESAYESCLAYELTEMGLSIERQKAVPIIYGRVKIDCGYRIDLLIEKSVIVELKSVEAILPIHGAQLLSYLRLTGLNVGLLINFNVYRLTNGIKRVVNNYSEVPRSQRSLR